MMDTKESSLADASHDGAVQLVSFINLAHPVYTFEHPEASQNGACQD